MAETLIKTSDEGYIIARKHKQNHTDSENLTAMTYKVLKECEKLIEENQKKTFWPEKSEDSKEGFAFP